MQSDHVLWVFAQKRAGISAEIEHQLHVGAGVVQEGVASHAILEFGRVIAHFRAEIVHFEVVFVSCVEQTVDLLVGVAAEGIANEGRGKRRREDTEASMAGWGKAALTTKED